MGGDAKKIQAFSTCQYSKSTGVARPKMETLTRSLPFSGSISSMVPSWLWNGPSHTRTGSPTANSTLGDGFRIQQGQKVFHLALAHGEGGVAGAGNADDTVNLLDKVPKVLVQGAVRFQQVHVGINIPGKEFAVTFRFFAVAHFGNKFRGDFHPVNEVGKLGVLRLADDAVTNAVFLSGEDVKDIPLFVRLWGTGHDRRKKWGE